ncbi:hypothetical protein PUND_a2629 [Pseudoalteromonas undina]|nr:hypothetical protein PUND_a2629 [Pseudoalteromonas undina]GAA73195.1 hypothetical protein P20439_3312 [Pseudoalteromonas sp. BSi20439]
MLFINNANNARALYKLPVPSQNKNAYLKSRHLNSIWPKSLRQCAH